MRPLIETPGYDRHRALRCFVYGAAATESPKTLDDLEAISEILKASHDFVWLDLAQPTPDDLALLQREFDIHPVAIEDGFFPITEQYDDRLVRLESRLFDSEKMLERTEREIFQFKRALTIFRAIVAPMREVLLRLTHTELEPLKPELSLYFRDVHDHVIRAIEQIDMTRDLVNSTLDIHLATQSHRQNEVSKQLTIIATIFLPLTYITGFFGQNFGWMVNNIVSPEIFWYLGVGSQVATIIILFAFFRSRRWL